MLDNHWAFNIASMAVAAKLLRVDIVILLVLHLLGVLEILLML